MKTDMSEWHTLYGPDQQPETKTISEYINNPLWETLNSYIQESYTVQPTYSYSRCAAQPGWNVKYKKAGKSLCTLYPLAGYFIALVVIGNKEVNEAEAMMPMCTEYIRDLFENTPNSAMGQWLMIQVTDETILEDVERLIALRRPVKK